MFQHVWQQNSLARKKKQLPLLPKIRDIFTTNDIETVLNFFQKIFQFSTTTIDENMLQQFLLRCVVKINLAYNLYQGEPSGNVQQYLTSNISKILKIIQSHGNPTFNEFFLTSVNFEIFKKIDVSSSDILLEKLVQGGLIGEIFKNNDKIDYLVAVKVLKILIKSMDTSEDHADTFNKCLPVICENLKENQVCSLISQLQTGETNLKSETYLSLILTGLKKINQKLSDINENSQNINKINDFSDMKNLVKYLKDLLVDDFSEEIFVEMGKRISNSMPLAFVYFDEKE